MKSLRVFLLTALCMAMSACVQMVPVGNRADAATNATAERQILVMLRAPPPHFRPDVAYGLAYDAGVRQGGQRRIADDLARQHDLKVVTAWPMAALGLDCFVLEAPSREAGERALEIISQDARVESAQAMNVFHVMAHDDPLYPLQPGGRVWHLAEVHKITTGRNVRVAAIDTGVEAGHPDLSGQVALARDFVAMADPVAEAHGTAVAGIIVARADDGIGIAGVAPGARLYALRACQQSSGQGSATCTTFALARALQFALDQDVQIINLSLGGPRDRLLGRLLDVAIARRVVVVGAADPRVGGGGFPASHPGVLGVGSDVNANLPADALLAPGRDIPTTMVGKTWGFVTGSSYAAAHVSGVVALLLERAPAMTTVQVRIALAPARRTDVAASQPAMVDACSVIARTTSACVCGCVVARDANTTRPH